MAESKQIMKLIPKIMNDIGPIKKDSQNKFQGYMFRGIDDVYKAVNPIFVKHGVFCVPIVDELIREEHKTKKGEPIYYTVVKVTYKFFASDESFIRAVVVGEGMDSSDKSANKAMSAAFKMAFFQVFCIPTEEGSVDSEIDSHKVQSKSTEKEEPVRTEEDNQAFKTCMSDELSRIGVETFYKILGNFGFESYEEITKRQDQLDVFAEIREIK